MQKIDGPARATEREQKEKYWFEVCLSTHMCICVGMVDFVERDKTWNSARDKTRDKAGYKTWGQKIH